MTARPSPFPSGSLNAALDAFKAACAREWPPEAFALVNQTLADLTQTGIQQTALQAGDTAPGFSLPDQEGRLVHGFPPELRELYLQFGIDLAAHNEDDSWTLPLPATFVIDQHAVIRSADVHVDYRNRAEPAQTIELLKELLT